MPRDASLTPADLIGKLHVLVRRLVEQHSRDGKIVDWLDGLTADCPRKRAAGVSDQCQARCPDLPKVL
jgi:hypothetical protein